MSDPIKQLIDDFNTGWTAGIFEKIEPILHEKVIFMAPDLKTWVTGKEACLQSIRDYVNNAKTKVFEVRNKEIQIWDQTAMVSIEYYIEYQMNHENYREKGTEFWTLHKEKDSWQMLWRAMVKNEKLE